MIDLKLRREELNLTLEEIGDHVGVTKSTVRKWENGLINNMGRDKIAKYAEILKISPLELIKDSSSYYKLTEKEKVDIGIEVDKLLKGLSSDSEVNFYGEPLTEEGKIELRTAIQMAMELNKEKAKKHFTPHKYRNE